MPASRSNPAHRGQRPRTPPPPTPTTPWLRLKHCIEKGALVVKTGKHGNK